MGDQGARLRTVSAIRPAVSQRGLGDRRRRARRSLLDRTTHSRGLSRWAEHDPAPSVDFNLELVARPKPKGFERPLGNRHLVLAREPGISTSSGFLYSCHESEKYARVAVLGHRPARPLVESLSSANEPS